MDRLISMVDFVDLQEETPTFDTPQIDWYDKEIDKLYKIRKYSKFLQQPLTLYMFVTCKLVDGIWVVLEEPEDLTEENFETVNPKIIEFEKAQERVLFEGFSLVHIDGMHVKNKEIFIGIGFKNARFKTIEDLVNFQNWTSNQYLELTPTAKKQIGL